MNTHTNDAAADHIGQKLQAALEPSRLSVLNNSHLHAGHAGSPNNGRSHFRVEIESDTLNSLSRVAAHQRVYAILDEDMASYIHALEIILLK